MTFPTAEGVRIDWRDLPLAVRDAVEGALGWRVESATTQAGGFSPGVAARLRGPHGARAFVKAVSTAQNPESPQIHRQEAVIAAGLPPSVPAPTLRWSYDDGDWVALVFDEVDGHLPELPWRPDDLTRVLDAMGVLARSLTPSPVPAPPARLALAKLFDAWRDIDDVAVATMPVGWRSRLDALVALEAGWRDAVDGETLAHCDVRADNILLHESGVAFVDWPWAVIGAAWLDLVLFLPTVTMQGGPDPETLWHAHPLSRGVDDDRVDAVIAACLGFFTRAASRPPEPGLPTLRPFQAGQAEQHRRWLGHRRRWS
jgi:hypothetical protein